MDPLVTICMPVYNGEQFLMESLTGVVNQSYSNLEILIVDDQSTDRSEEIIRSFSEKDNRIVYVQNDINLGLVGNWNKCLNLAKGDWIKFHFQDDLIHIEGVENLLRSAQQNEVSLVISDRSYTGADRNISLYNDPSLRLSNSFKSGIVDPESVFQLFRNDFLGKNFLGEPIVGLFSKKLIDKYGVFNNTLKQICDFEYWLRICTNESFYFLDESLVTFRVHQSSASKRNESGKGSPSYSDRLVLARLLVSDKHFEHMRQIAKNSGVDFVLEIRKKITYLIEEFGLLRSFQWIGFRDRIDFYRFTLRGVVRGLVNDVKRTIG